ncbi:MAG: sigma-70 family RNA polymerase sigma factor [Nocardiopsaceae bacterium]|nr:sigma-70 family RNA polymerase sigma factor [Nocardiopsaceae bacterium]
MGPQEASFAKFYRESKDSCLRAVLASTGDRHLAEDCAAEAFARAWASWRKVSRHPVPSAWVIRTALNLSVSAWRKGRREVLLDHRRRSRAVSPATDADLEGPDSSVMTMIAGLPERQRQVIALRVFLDLDTATTARVLGIAPGTVTAHLARAIAALRQQLAPACQQEESS